MQNTIRRFIPTLVIATLFSLLMFSVSPTAALACTSVTITNNTSCQVNLTFYDASNATFTIGGIAPGTAAYPFPGTFVPVGLVTLLGNHIPSPNPCVKCVQLQVSGTITPCCAFVCSAPPCTITINPATPCPGTCS